MSQTITPKEGDAVVDEYLKRNRGAWKEAGSANHK